MASLNAPMLTPANESIFEAHHHLQKAYEALRSASVRLTPGSKRGRVLEAQKSVDTALAHLYLCPVKD